MTISFALTGVKQLVANFKAAEKTIIAGQRKANLRTAIFVVNKAKVFSPVRLVHGGTLKASIRNVPARGKLNPSQIVFTKITYAPFQELGTRFMDAQPYLRPALALAGNSRYKKELKVSIARIDAKARKFKRKTRNTRPRSPVRIRG